MKPGNRVLSAVALVVAVAWLAPAPGWAVCPFSSQYLQGGILGAAATANLAPDSSTLPELAGFWWEVGFGDPTDGAGADSGILGFVPGPGEDANWVKRDNPARPGEAVIAGSWGDGGVDGCLSGADAGAGVMAFYLLDGAGNYALASVVGQDMPIKAHDLDNVGQDIVLADSAVNPATTVDPATCNTTGGNAGTGTCTGDVADPVSSVNCYDDGNGQCGDGSLFGSGTQLIERDPGGGNEAVVAGCETGCVAFALSRDKEYCWDTNDDGLNDGSDTFPVIGTPGSAGGTCAIGLGACTSDGDCGLCEEPVAGLACDPNDAGACFGLAPCNSNLDTCAVDPPLLIGPELPAGCTLIAGPSVSDTVTTTPASRLGQGLVSLQWQAEQFTITHFDIVGKRPNGQERNIRTVLRQGPNDGQLQQYEEVVSRGDLRGAKDLVLRTFLTDGSSFDTDF